MSATFGVEPALRQARIAVMDMMLVAGLDSDEARAATREEERGQPAPEILRPGAGREGWLGRIRRRFR
jgi:hypothetical protein